MTEHRSPLDAALDLVVYAPLGLALTIGEELPRLAAKGRSTLTGRVRTARVVGQFAVAQGRQGVERRLRTEPAPAPRAAPAATAGPAATAAPAPRPAPAGRAAPAASGPAAAVGANGSGAATPGPDALAIPGYDSLSASQVVQRLGGLSADELGAVAHYEAANRGRRTILARVTQLQGQ